LNVPLTRSRPARTITLLIVPPAAVTVIPRFGLVSMLAPPGVIESRTAAGAAVDAMLALEWLAADLLPLEQPPASRPSAAQTASVAISRRRGRDR
jgi:hypothetical protein